MAMLRAIAALFLLALATTFMRWDSSGAVPDAPAAFPAAPVLSPPPPPRRPPEPPAADPPRDAPSQEAPLPPPPANDALDVADPPPDPFSSVHPKTLQGTFDLAAPGLDELVAQGALPGYALLVFDGRTGKLGSRYGGFADAERNVRASEGTLWRFASVTKAVTAAAALALAERGRLDLNSWVERHLPEFSSAWVSANGTDKQPAKERLKVVHLLTMTAGYPYAPPEPAPGDPYRGLGFKGWYFSSDSVPIRERVGVLAGVAARHEPGEAWTYGYASDILGAVLEAAAGEPLDALFRSLLFDSVGMNSTAFFVPPGREADLAAVYLTGTNGLERAPDGAGTAAQGDYASGPRRCFSGGAGLVGTAGDFLRFARMLLANGFLDGARAMKLASVSMMRRPWVRSLYGNGNAAWGFSVEVRPRGKPTEYGWAGAYGTAFAVVPGRGCWVFASQVLGGGRARAQARAREAAGEALAVGVRGTEGG
ncbi:beta-lactamase/transpeptidase-like protein [Hyaloraphidium curvatum]|nr:beta-lactamase/transpeptidase-like protein [Hyaloraphidium curvatum]